MIRLTYAIWEVIIPLAFLLSSCTPKAEQPDGKTSTGMERISMEMISKPYARYWWFASEIKKEDIEFNLDWLSQEWQEVVSYALLYADSIGLACDLTMGTLWPFGDSYVPYEQASQQFGEEERQVITRSWEYPKTGYVVDHINPGNYLPYFYRMLDSLTFIRQKR
jgi:hypothetical protein